ncbi:MAG: hypothetical protein MI723_08910 [Caulobacterales bacterium]|nr:hypothetical protein [Caulobacterales bacterium]
MSDPLHIFLAVQPGLEPLLLEEAREHGFRAPEAAAGGVTIRGGWPDVWRANLQLRGASRVLVRLGAFYAAHLAQLDKRARQLPWSAFLAPNTPIRVEATCRKSRIYHSGAAAERIAAAAVHEAGAREEGSAPLRVLVRIAKDLCTVSIDASGELLHKRGFKEAVAKAPLRETLAALFLRACGYRGEGPVLDPMCGSGTFVIEAAEIAAGLAPGRARAFAFERLAGFDRDAWEAMRAAAPAAPRGSTPQAFGFDRDAGAIAMSRANAARAGLAELTQFRQQTLSDAEPPGEAKGLVVINPPYGARIGERSRLMPLYQSLGRRLRERFAGWRVGLVTSDLELARATGLPFGEPGPPAPHGSIRIRLFQSEPLE